MATNRDQKIVLITGANTGLGLEIVKSLCRSTTSYAILVGSRDLSKASAAIAEAQKEYPSTTSILTPIQADLSSDSSLEACIATISSTYPRLDILVNNGGASYDQQIQSGTLTMREGWNASWDTNVAGTQVLTTLAVPLLLKSKDPRLIFMTSGTSTMTETVLKEDSSEMLKRINGSPAKGWPKAGGANPITAYRSSKAGLNMMMREWVRVLKEDGVKTWCVSPGFLATGLAGVGAEQLKKVSDLPVLDWAQGDYADYVIRWVHLILQLERTSRGMSLKGSAIMTPAR